MLQVKYWITHNEPYETCWSAYGKGEDAPGLTDHPDTYPYTCAHTIILSHAKVWHTYNDNFRAQQKGRLFTRLNVDGGKSLYHVLWIGRWR